MVATATTNGHHVNGTGGFPDRDIIASFLETIWPEEPPGRIAICHRNRDGEFAVASLAQSIEEAVAVTLRAAQYSCVWYGIGAIRRDKQSGRGEFNDIVAIPGLWLEVDFGKPGGPPDIETAVDIAKSMPLPPSMIVSTGHGIHAYWLFKEAWELPGSAERGLAQSYLHGWRQQLIRELARRGFGAPDAVSDLPRVFRPAGTENQKDPQHKLPVVVILVDDTRYLPEDFEQFIPETVDPEPAQPKQVTDDPNWEIRPGDDFNATVGWPTVADLIKWKCRSRQNGRFELLRCACEKYGAPSSSFTGRTGHKGVDRITIFSGNCGLKSEPDEQGRRPSYSKFELYAAVRFPRDDRPGEGDFTEATKALINLGYGKAKPKPELKAAEWPEPKPLRNALPAVESFDARNLPAPFRPWIEDIAERMQCPLDLPAVSAMCSLSALVGRRLGIRPKQRDDWQTTPNLWALLIAPPGFMKSPVVAETTKPLKKLEIEAGERFARRMQEYCALELVGEARAAAAKKLIKKATDAGDVCYAKELAEKSVSETPKPPARERFIVNDITVEKLGDILNQNSNGVLILRDEWLGLMKQTEKQGNENLRQFLLEGWDGNGRYTFDRVVRGTIEIPHVCLSILGTTQPGPLTQYLRDAAESGAEADGLIQRFQLMVYPDAPEDWQNVDQWPDRESRDDAYAVFTMLSGLTGDRVGAEVDQWNPEGQPFLRFTRDAQAAFDDWRYRQETRVRGGDDDHVILSHLHKYKSLIPSLALLIHLAEIQDDAGAVGLSAVERAIGWGDYLETHARRVFSLSASERASAAVILSRKILDGSLKGSFTSRDVYRKAWSGLSSQDTVDKAIDALVVAGWVRERTDATAGRPRGSFEINPRIFNEGQKWN